MASPSPSTLAPWIYLFAGIFCEIAGTTGMRALLYVSPELSQASATAGIAFVIAGMLAINLDKPKPAPQDRN